MVCISCTGGTPLRLKFDTGLSYCNIRLKLASGEFDTMGESSDSLSMGHIAPPTLTSTLHRASQGNILTGTLPRHPPPHSNPTAHHMAAGVPGSNPSTISRIPSDTHPRAPQGSFYYS